MGHESVVVLFKGGRVPSWYALTAEQHDEYQRLHVDLMLSVAREHGMTRLEGYRLLGTQQFWRLFWAIEFPTVEGAEAWIAAEIRAAVRGARPVRVPSGEAMGPGPPRTARHRPARRPKTAGRRSARGPAAGR